MDGTLRLLTTFSGTRSVGYAPLTDSDLAAVLYEGHRSVPVSACMSEAQSEFVCHSTQMNLKGH